jgi:hypothetical protein
MKYAGVIDLLVMIYIPIFIKTGSGIRELMGGGGIHRYTHTGWRSQKQNGE